MKLLWLHQTCPACPAQWEGVTDERQWVYVRARHGKIGVGVSDSFAGAVRAEMESPWFSAEVEDDAMSTTAMLALTGLSTVCT